MKVHTVHNGYICVGVNPHAGCKRVYQVLFRVNVGAGGDKYIVYLLPDMLAAQ